MSLYTNEQIEAGYAQFFENLQKHVTETVAILAKQKAEEAAKTGKEPVVVAVVVKQPSVWATGVWKEEEYY